MGRIEFEKGTRIDIRNLNIENLEVDEDVIIKGDLTVQGTEIVEMTETHYGDLEITSPYELRTDYINEYTEGEGISFLSDINIGHLEFPIDGGANLIHTNLPIQDASEGTEESYGFYIGGQPILKIYGESDGAGGVQNKKIVSYGDIDLGGNKLKTTNLLIKEWDSSHIAIRNVNDTGFKSLYLYFLRLTGSIRFQNSGSTIDTPASASAYITFRSYDGSAYIDNLKLIGGVVEIYRGKLIDSLNANNANITNINAAYAKYIYSISGSSLVFRPYGSSELIAFQTRDSGGNPVDRLIFTNGVDVADIKIVNADLDIGDNKIKTTNLLLKEIDSNDFAIRNRDDTAYKGLIFGYGQMLSGDLLIGNGCGLKTGGSASDSLILKSHDGSAYVTNLKLVGGYVEIYQGKLTSKLNANGLPIEKVQFISGWASDSPLKLISIRTPTNPGNGIEVYTRNSSNVDRIRIAITSGYDTADIKIANAHLIPDMANNGAIGIEYYVDDYGGNFVNFTPPNGFEGRIIAVADTNSSNPGQRLYVYINGSWRHVDLS